MTLATAISTLLSSLFVLPYLYLFVYLSGRTLITSLKLKKLDQTSIALISGFSFYSLTLYLFRFFNLPFFLAELFLLTLNLIILKPSFPNFTRFRFSINPLKLRSSIIAFFIIAASTALIQSAVLLRSATVSSAGISFANNSYHDSMQHLSIIKRLYISSNVTHPGFSGSTLINYHYLIDLSLAAITRFSFVSLFDTYYRLYPLLISSVFSLSIFTFVRHLTKDEWLANLALLFSLFSGNLSFYTQFFRGPEFTWGSSTFLINPLIDLLQNPASIFVLAQTLTVVHLLSLYHYHLSTNRFSSKPSHHTFSHSRLNCLNSLIHLISFNHLKYLLPLTITAGTMIGFKAWGGLLIIAGLFFASIFSFIKSKTPHLFFAWLGTIIISIILFLPHYDPTASASPVWAPFWSLRKMVEDPGRWNNLKDIFLEEHYQYKHNLPRLALLYSKWLLIYLIGNYGFKLLGFLVILGLPRKWKNLTPATILIFTTTTLSFSLPIFFNQGRMAYDIEQFSPYALLFSAIFTVIVLFRLLSLIKRKYSLTLPLNLMLVIIILLSAPSNLINIKLRFTDEKTLIDYDSFHTYELVTQSTSPNDVILVYPSHRQIADLHFAALTNRNTFYSGKTLSIITGENYQDREQQILNFFDHWDLSTQQQYVSTHHLTHLFLYQEETDQCYLNPNLVQVVFNNQGDVLYRLNTN